MKTNLVLPFLLSCAVTFINAQDMKPRYKQGCELLGKKIYCFGGGARDLNSAIPDFDDSFYNDHYVLDLTNFNSDQDASKLKWEAVPPPTNGYTLEPRADFAHVKVNDNSYIVFGGAGTQKGYSNSPNIRNLTSIYFADSNTWQTIPASNFLPQTQLNSQSFGASATMDSSGTVWLFGGISPNPSFPALNLNSTIIKITSQDSKWSNIDANGVVVNGSDPFQSTFHHATLAMPNGHIYAYGGRLDSLSQGFTSVLKSPTNYANSQTSYKVRSTSYYNYDYNIRNVSGNVTEQFFPNQRTYPTSRELHTLTQISNSNIALLYGGTIGVNIVNDYCYTYDSSGNAWNKITFPGGGPGPRYGHSAISYGNDSIFIMFGANPSGVMQSDTYLLNTSTYTWYQVSGQQDGGSGNPGIGTPAIVGIVIGSLAAVVIIAGVGYYMYRRGVFNSGNEPTQITEIVYNDQFGNDYERPTDEKFVNPVGFGAYRDDNNNNNNNNNNNSTSSPSEASYPMTDMSRNYNNNNNNHNGFSTTSSESGGIKVLMKPAETVSDGGFSSPTTSDNYTQYSAAAIKPSEPITMEELGRNNKTKPHARLSSEDNNSTTGLVKPSGFD